MKRPASNPHGDPVQCDVCHISTTGGAGGLRSTGGVSRLCQSCHDGRGAAREAHPIGMAPSNEIKQRIPQDFPLVDGVVSCLTCHDVTQDCKPTAPDSRPTRSMLRGGQVASPMMFCFHCHPTKSYKAFNAHDQVANERPKTDTCLWCHTSVPDVSWHFGGGATQALRRESSTVCRNCHQVTKDHPTGGSHMGAKPTKEMIWHMSAYEMQSTMRLSFAQLLKYARAMNRAPRSMPFDSEGRITCFTCHNPHEEGLLPARNPRSVGAEPKKAVNHRLRAHQGNICVACHEK